MATFVFGTNNNTFYWPQPLLAVLRSGVFDNTSNSPVSVLTLSAGLVQLKLTGNLSASGARDLTGGSVTSVELVVNGQSVFVETGFTAAPGFAAIQAVLDFLEANPLATNSTPGYNAVLGPAFFDDGLNVTSPGANFTFFRGGAGTDTFTNGSGNGIIDYNWATQAVAIDFSSNSATDGTSTDTLVGFAEAVGSSFNDTFTARAFGGYHYWFGGNGADTYNGSANVFETVSYRFEEGTLGVIVSLASGTGTDAFGQTETLSSIDALDGSRNDDTLTGNGGANSFRGFAGDDTINGGGGGDWIGYHRELEDGGTHGVIVNLSNVAVAVAANSIYAGNPLSVAAHTAKDTFGDTDTLTSIERISGTRFADLIVGDNGGNDLEGNAGNDIVRGGGGSFDWLGGGSGTDQVSGDAGYDQLDFSGRNSTGLAMIAAGLGGGSVSGAIRDNDSNALAAVHTTFQTIERFVGSDADDNLKLSSSFTGTADSWDVGNGVRGLIVAGMDGADTYTDNSVGIGRMIVTFDQEKRGHSRFQDHGDSGGAWGSHAGEFGVIVNLSGALVSANIGYGSVGTAGGRARDTFGNVDIMVRTRSVELTDAKDYLKGGTLGLFVDSRGGNDTIDAGSASDTVYGGEGNDVIRGFGGHDGLNGGNGNDTLDAGEGDDYLEGGNGNDKLTGGSGNNYYNPGAGADLISGGGDFDKLSYREMTGTHGIKANWKTHKVFDVSGATDTFNVAIEAIKGSRFNDTFIGDARDNNVEGMKGNDTFNGGAGLDQIEYMWEQELPGSTRGVVLDLQVAIVAGHIRGTASDTYGGTDTLIDVEFAVGSRLNDKLTGSRVFNYLNGLDGNDTIKGEAGDDDIFGGLGRDTLIGGAGSDDFAYSNANDSKAATADIIKDFDDFGNDRIELSLLTAGTLTYRGLGAFTGARQVHIKDIAGPDVLVEVNLGGTLAPELVIRLANTTAASMTASDFGL